MAPAMPAAPVATTVDHACQPRRGHHDGAPAGWRRETGIGSPSFPIGLLRRDIPIARPFAPGARRPASARVKTGRAAVEPAPTTVLPTVGGRPAPQDFSDGRTAFAAVSRTAGAGHRVTREESRVTRTAGRAIPTWHCRDAAAAVTPGSLRTLAQISRRGRRPGAQETTVWPARRPGRRRRNGRNHRRSRRNTHSARP
jgi:hypothetical protein